MNLIDRFKKIFEFSSNTFVTVRTLRVVYWLQVLLGGGLMGTLIYYGFQQSIVLGVIALLFAPLVFLIFAVLLRVFLEIVILIFKTAEYTNKISELWKDVKKEYINKEDEEITIELESGDEEEKI